MTHLRTEEGGSYLISNRVGGGDQSILCGESGEILPSLCSGGGEGVQSISLYVGGGITTVGTLKRYNVIYVFY